MIDDIPVQDSNISSTNNRGWRVSQRGQKRKLSHEEDDDYLNGSVALEHLQLRLMDHWYDWHYAIEWYNDRDTTCPCPLVQCPQIGSTSTRKFKLPCVNSQFSISLNEIPNCHDGLCAFIYCVNEPCFDFIFLL